MSLEGAHAGSPPVIARGGSHSARALLGAGVLEANLTEATGISPFSPSALSIEAVKTHVGLHLPHSDLPCQWIQNSGKWDEIWFSWNT